MYKLHESRHDITIAARDLWLLALYGKQSSAIFVIQSVIQEHTEYSAGDYLTCAYCQCREPYRIGYTVSVGKYERNYDSIGNYGWQRV